MDKHLFFRTDRQGDFLITAILIKSIKRNNPNTLIHVVASIKNYDYIKSFEFVDKVFLFKKGLVNRLKLIHDLKKNKYNNIIIHDAKKRSKIITFFLNKKNTINTEVPSNITYINDIKRILKSLNYSFDKLDLDILNKRILVETYVDKVIKHFKNPYILFHFDEKWIHKEYITKYTNIEPSVNELIFFFNSIILKTNQNLVITTGIKTPDILNKIFSNKINSKIFFYENLSFLDIEKIVDKSNLLISCHGAISHMAAAKNIKIIDIIDPSYHYFKWTDHFRNYYALNRKKFSELSKEIANLI
mgnify:FL=1|jgi:ADP-heptose:LPS heptosyltransferase|tara:strand:- start:607 stop:1512 length:906 start_codon:yes stop_codon:yes gene_type:complete